MATNKLSLVFLLLAGSQLSADTITFRNGDVLKGKVTGLTVETVTFASDILGEVTVDRAKVAKLDTSFAVKAEGQAEEGPERSPAWEFFYGMIHPYSPFGWDGHFELGLALNRSTTETESYRAAFDAKKIIGTSEFDSGAYYEFKSTTDSNDVETTDTDRYGGFFAYTRVIPWDFTLAGETRLGANRIQEIALQYDTSILLGKRFPFLESGVFEVQIGRTANYVDPITGESDWAFLWDFRQQLNYEFSRFRFEQSARYQVDPEDDSRSAILLDLAAIIKLSNYLDSVFRYEYEDTSLATDEDLEEERITASLAIPF